MKLRIMFVIKALGAGPGGGAERILALVSSGLADRGHEVTVLTFDGPADTDFYELSPKVGRVRLGLGQTSRRSDVSTTLRRLFAIRRTVAALRPQVAVGFMHSSFVPLSAALLATALPVIGSERTSFAHYRRRPLQRLLLRATLPLMKTVTVNNEEVRTGFPAPIAKKMFVLPNPVLKAKRLADPVGGEVKTLLSVGGLREEKDQATLLSAFADLAPDFADWRLRIVGAGPLRERLERQIADLGLNGRAELAGALSSVESEYADAQLFVLPSMYEAFPNCLAEALAHGLPAVGFADCPGTNELIVPNINGELAAGPVRVRALGTSLGRLMSSPSLRQTLARAAPSIVDRYPLAQALDKWEELLRGCVTPGRPEAGPANASGGDCPQRAEKPRPRRPADEGSSRQ
jgi:glycosyltransferase involved in cell wall biosynthesis